MATFEGSICKACGYKTYPRHARCPSCGKREFDRVQLKGAAKLLTFTRVHMLSLAYTERFITLGIVEFASGFRALGRLLVEEPRVGMKLKAEIGTVRTEDGEKVAGLCFREA
ncbi:MAG TPA: hypothetical protein VMU02_03590 [bacterium]|nr:hypothetical protein [bacterium]